ncbi:MAG: hypothetical protein KDE53_17190, partial [Caldilineaceae bacterium]|nr:hypothetical protein [Caldilineaceae bacterium]
LAPAAETEQFQGRQRQIGFGALFHANLTYSTLRIVLPIVLEACRQIGQCYLFCADEMIDSIALDAYTHYTQALSAQIRQLAISDDPALQLFWQERAIVLSSLSREAAHIDSAHDSLPEMDPTALRLLQQLNPALTSEQQAKKLPRLVTPLKRQRSQTRKEGGVDGIRVTRRMDDINNILLSEFMHPRLLLLDRILNTGYLAIERPPERVKLRDVLIAALMPGDLQPTLHVDFLKACWFDCMMQVSVLLRHHKLHQSEFRWIEGDPFDQVRSTVFLLNQMPIFESEIEEAATAGYRDEFLRALRWLPTFLDARGAFQPLQSTHGSRFADLRATMTDPAFVTEPTATPLPQPAVPAADQPAARAEQLKAWLRTAWANQRESRVWQQQEEEAAQRRPHNDQLAVAEFAYVHIMLFLPARQRQGTFGAFSPRGGQLERLFAAKGRSNQTVSITWVPDELLPSKGKDAATLTPSDKWGYEVKGEASKAPLPNDRDDLDGKEIARLLEQAWLDQLLKEMWRG